MSETTAIPDIQARAAESKAPRGKTFASHPLVQLTIVRFLETLREPEALFWIFAFPILLAGGLGIAFRNRPAEVLKIATTNPVLAQSLEREKLLAVQLLDSPAAELALRTGKIALLAVPNANGSVVYSYDDTNPEGRTARMLADRAVQQTAGRVDPIRTSDEIMREAGSRYIDFLIPGLLGMNLMGSAIWGMGFTVVDARRKKLLKRLIATPMPKQYFLLSYVLSRILMLVAEVGIVLWFRRMDFSRAGARLAARSGGSVSTGLADVQRAGIAAGLARQNHRSRFRLDERRDATDVDRFRRFLFRAAFPRCGATDHQSASAHCGHRRAARQHAARRKSRSVSATARRPERLAPSLLRPSPKTLPLALIFLSCSSQPSAPPTCRGTIHRAPTCPGVKC